MKISQEGYFTEIARSSGYGQSVLLDLRFKGCYDGKDGFQIEGGNISLNILDLELMEFFQGLWTRQHKCKITFEEL